MWGSPPKLQKCANPRAGVTMGGGCITNFLLNYLPLQMQFFSKIHIGLVWLFGFLVFTKFIKITIRSDSLIVFWEPGWKLDIILIVSTTSCEGQDINQIYSRISEYDSLIFYVELTWKSILLSVKNIAMKSQWQLLTGTNMRALNYWHF